MCKLIRAESAVEALAERTAYLSELVREVVEVPPKPGVPVRVRAWWSR